MVIITTIVHWSSNEGWYTFPGKGLVTAIGMVDALSRSDCELWIVMGERGTSCCVDSWEAINIPENMRLLLLFRNGFQQELVEVWDSTRPCWKWLWLLIVTWFTVHLNYCEYLNLRSVQMSLFYFKILYDILENETELFLLIF